MQKLLTAGAFAALLALPVAAAAQASVAPIDGSVNDRARMLTSQDRGDLKLLLDAFKRDTGVAIAVLTVYSTQPETVAQCAARVLARWREDTGDPAREAILVLVTKENLHTHIKVSRGLDGVLPDVTTNLIIQRDMGPLFMQGDIYGGIQIGVTRMGSIIGRDPSRASAPPEQKSGALQGANIGWFLAGLFVFFGIVGYVLFSVNPRGTMHRTLQEAKLARDADRRNREQLLSAAEPEVRRYAIEFTASAGEYFRIWIVNLALTIVTLGIYSAWAKVRKKRYFYSHTWVDGDNFEYRGKPLAILKGRLIAVAVVALLFGVREFAPQFQWSVLAAAAFALPWLLVRSLAFNAYNTAYRNIRLHFRGSYGECLKLFLGYGMLTLVTAGIAYAFLRMRLTEFIVRNHYYGSTRFAVADLKKLFLNAYGKAVGLVLLGAMLIAAFAAFFVNIGLKPASSGYSMAVTVLGYAGYLVLYAYLRVRTTNATWNNANVGPLRFECSLGAVELIVLYFVNIAAIVATLGLATPWAVVRTMRYRASKMVVLASGGLDGFVAAESAQFGAAGEEVGEMLDIDLGL